MIRKSTFLLLRVPFSFFLMPVYFFALSQAPEIDYGRALLAFVILHFFIYPASNGYNSFMDRDTGSIGLLKTPPPAHKELFYVTLLLDGAAVLLSLFLGTVFTLCALANIAASRAYSYRGIRLKKLPITGFLTVIIFQGAITYFMVFTGASPAEVPSFSREGLFVPWPAMLISSLLFGSLYPLTQIYQHQQDMADDVKTISYQLGYMGTFVFSAFMYLLAEVLLFFYLEERGQGTHFWLLQLFFLPVMLYFLYWWHKVWRERKNASYRYAMQMNAIAATCTNAGFLLLFYLNHWAA